MSTLIDAERRSRHERRFYVGAGIVMLAAVFLGFGRTYFLRPWFPEAAVLAPTESFFFNVHGVCFTAWMVLLVAQTLLIANRRVAFHRILGWFGVGLAVTVVFVGVAGALMAARRPGGFIGVPLPPLQFLVIPLADLALFALFVTWAVFRRHDAQSHKRLMLLATIGLIDAAVARFPFVDMMVPVGMMWSRADLGVDLFLVAMITWDLISRRSIHPVTLIGAVVVIASQPLRMLLSETSAWMSFAAWAVRLPGS